MYITAHSVVICQGSQITMESVWSIEPPQKRLVSLATLIKVVMCMINRLGFIDQRETLTGPDVPPCKAKRQSLLTFQVNSYCLWLCIMDLYSLISGLSHFQSHDRIIQSPDVYNRAPKHGPSHLHRVLVQCRANVFEQSIKRYPNSTLRVCKYFKCTLSSS